MDIDLANLEKTQGFKITSNRINNLGSAVDSAGDINGDGINDIIIGAKFASPLNRPQAGESYIIFGKNISNIDDIVLSSLTNIQGFKIFGDIAGDQSGLTVSGAGDINNDGINDIIVGAPNALDSKGEIYVLYGKNSTILNDIDLKSFNKTQGFKIIGANSGDRAGDSVNSAGDINGDSIDDIIFGARFASPSYRKNAGESYVIFGRNSNLFDDIDLAKFNNSHGFKVLGVNTNDQSGAAVSGLGDINGDGIDDIIIGAPSALDNAGESYVIYGKNSTIFNDIDLKSFNKTQGFIIQGAKQGDNSGFAVSRAGDVNKDEINDIIISAWLASPLALDGRNNAGEVYVIFGKNSTFFEVIDLVKFNNNYGFRILGAYAADNIGNNLRNAGDVNKDGIDDIIIGARLASSGSLTNAGKSYIVYGKKTTLFDDIDLKYLNSLQGIEISGANAFDISGNAVSGVGDINGDGVDDIIVCSPNSPSSPGNSTSYVIYGSKSNDDSSILNSILTIGIPVISGVILTLGTTYGIYKYKQEGTICGYHIGNHESEQTHLINQAPGDTETWYT